MDWTKRTWALFRLWSPHRQSTRLTIIDRPTFLSPRGCPRCRQHAIHPNRPMSLPGMARLSGLFSRERHCDRGVFVVLDISPLPPCPPSLHRVLLHGFIATMRTLTPAEPLPTCRSRFVVRVLNTRQVSLLIAFELPTIPSSTTASPFLHDRFSTLHHRHGLLASIPRGDPVGQGICPSRESRVRLLPGSSPTGLAVSGSLVLRTGRSSQVALHLSSWKRSYHCRLQAGNVSLGRTSTFLFKRLHRRTSLHRSA
jgi:hypothetical protein